MAAVLRLRASVCWTPALLSNSFRAASSAPRPTHRPPGASRRAQVRKPQQSQPTQASQSGSSLQWYIDGLQGAWGDDLGIQITISGNEARFSDGTGPWKFEFSESGLALRGALLVGTLEAPTWRFHTGEERQWARLDVAKLGGREWAEAFFHFKAERLELRRQLRAAYAALDFTQIEATKSRWTVDSDIPPGLTEEQRSALLAGQAWVPGACFKHRQFGYRGVILACDPWCTYPASWRAKWLPKRPKSEAQAFYHCLVDERDRPGRQSRYVAEENLEPGDLIFPIQAALAEMLLRPCPEFGGYLPGQKLDEALKRQISHGGNFSL